MKARVRFKNRQMLSPVSNSDACYVLIKKYKFAETVDIRRWEIFVKRNNILFRN